MRRGSPLLRPVVSSSACVRGIRLRSSNGRMTGFMSHLATHLPNARLRADGARLAPVNSASGAVAGEASLPFGGRLRAAPVEREGAEQRPRALLHPGVAPGTA